MSLLLLSNSAFYNHVLALARRDPIPNHINTCSNERQGGEFAHHALNAPEQMESAGKPFHAERERNTDNNYWDTRPNPK